MDQDTALVVLSGGQDSTTCLFLAMRKYKKVHAVTFNYGQKHSRELEAAVAVAKLAGVDSHEIVDTGPILSGTSPLTDPTQHLEQYVDWKSLPGGLEKTFVPGRNILFLTLAANRAYCLRAAHLITGICEEDSGGYPDCTEHFRVWMQGALQAGFGLKPGELNIEAPLMFMDKAASVKLAYGTLGAYEALAFSHTAYDGAYPPTGHDHATLLREKGFYLAALPDPLIVRAFDEGFLEELPGTSNYDAVKGNQLSTDPFADPCYRMNRWTEMKAIIRGNQPVQLSMFGGVLD